MPSVQDIYLLCKISRCQYIVKLARRTWIMEMLAQGIGPNNYLISVLHAYFTM